MSAANNLFSKRNVLIGGSVGLCLLGAGYLYYTSNQRKLYQQLWDKAPDTNDVADGIYGDWHDVLNCPCWNPQYLSLATIQKPTIDIVTASKYAQDILAAKGFALLPDNEPAIISVFQKLKNWADVAKVSQAFTAVSKGQQLKDFLEKVMNDEGVIGGLFTDHKNRMEEIYNIISRLPK